jgi:hypothetical protein
MTEQKELHPTGLNIIQNPDGSIAFEWDPKDKRWSWMNGLTDDRIQSIIEEAIQTQSILENVANGLELPPSLGVNE